MLHDIQEIWVSLWSYYYTCTTPASNVLHIDTFWFLSRLVSSTLREDNHQGHRSNSTPRLHFSFPHDIDSNPFSKYVNIYFKVCKVIPWQFLRFWEEFMIFKWNHPIASRYWSPSFSFLLKRTEASQILGYVFLLQYSLVFMSKTKRYVSYLYVRHVSTKWEINHTMSCPSYVQTQVIQSINFKRLY